MSATENTMKGLWLEAKGDIQKAWGKLTDDELEKTKGDIKAIGGLIQQKYGESQKRYSKKLTAILKAIEGPKDNVVSSAKKRSKILRFKY